jgi:hypothetical protein
VDRRIGVGGREFGIGFELRLPQDWSGRFYFQGGGGYDGLVREAVGPYNPGLNAQVNALSRGFAVVTTDGGHLGTDASFGLDPQARIDHAYNAYDVTAVTAKALIGDFYGRGPDYSYVVACSGGGRHGMMFSQRFPTYFDGVISAAPAMKVAKGASISAIWETQTYTEIAPKDASGAPILSRAFSDADLALLSDTILRSCDAKDGLADGLIDNPRSCDFDPAVLQCLGAKTDSCLSAEQVAALQKGFGGPQDSAGRQLYSTWPYDSGISAPDWRNWKLGTSTTSVPNSRFVTLIFDAARNQFFTPPDPTFDFFQFNFDTDPARFDAYAALYDTSSDVNLTPFKRGGGKILFWHGVSDPIFSANDTIDYYERLVNANGGLRKAGKFARLFLVPGMTHCSGGPALTDFDPLSAIVDWVEKGSPPRSILARGTPTAFPGRSRPLCPYPQQPRYTGTGSIEEAANFTCRRAQDDDGAHEDDEKDREDDDDRDKD